MRKFAFGMLFALPLILTANSVQVVQPNGTYSVGFQLVYTKTGLPAPIPNVPVYFTVENWQLYFGGHSHDNSLADGRPRPTPATNPKFTDANGHVTFSVSMPRHSGYFTTIGSIPTTYCASVPNVSCTPAYIDFNVSNKPNFSASWYQPATSVGYTFSTLDHDHPGKGTWGSNQVAGALKGVADVWNVLKPATETALLIDRMSLPQGGWYDGYLVGPLWSSINADPHQWGEVWDMVSPTGSTGKAKFFTALATYCAGSVFDFTHQDVIAAFNGATYTTTSEARDGLSHIWHVNCSFEFPSTPPQYSKLAKRGGNL